MSGVQGQAIRRDGMTALLSRLRVPALLLLIGGNLLYFGGNAAIDLWQTLGPGTRFTGTIAAHDDVLTKGENAQEYFVLSIASNRGPLKFDVFQHTFNDTSVGQQVVGEIDAQGVLGHDEALRTLTADGKTVFRADPVARSLPQLVILLISLTVSSVALRAVLRSRRRTPAAQRSGRAGGYVGAGGGTEAERRAGNLI